MGCEFEVRLVPRPLDYVKPVTKKPVAKTARPSGPHHGRGMARARARPRLGPRRRGHRGGDPAAQDVLPLWRLERACRAWAAETPFPVHDLVALVLGGVPPQLAAVRLTFTHRPSTERGDTWRRKGEGGMAREITLVDRTGEVTETQLLTLWRAGRKKLGRYRRQRMTPEQEAFITVVRRVLAQGLPSTYFSASFWTRVVKVAGGVRPGGPPPIMCARARMRAPPAPSAAAGRPPGAPSALPARAREVARGR